MPTNLILFSIATAIGLGVILALIAFIVTTIVVHKSKVIGGSFRNDVTIIAGIVGVLVGSIGMVFPHQSEVSSETVKLVEYSKGEFIHYSNDNVLNYRIDKKKTGKLEGVNSNNMTIKVAQGDNKPHLTTTVTKWSNSLFSFLPSDTTTHHELVVGYTN